VARKSEICNRPAKGSWPAGWRRWKSSGLILAQIHINGTCNFPLHWAPSAQLSPAVPLCTVSNRCTVIPLYRRVVFTGPHKLRLKRRSEAAWASGWMLSRFITKKKRSFLLSFARAHSFLCFLFLSRRRVDFLAALSLSAFSLCV